MQLANLFGVKRGLIRKVLTRLAHSRLVEQTPNRGATVAKPVGARKGKDLFAARRVLESAILETLIAEIDDRAECQNCAMLKKRTKGLPGAGDSERGRSNCRSIFTVNSQPWPATACSRNTWTTSSAAPRW